MWVLLIILVVLALAGTSLASGFSLPSSGGTSAPPDTPLVPPGFPVNPTGVKVYTSDGSITGSAITPDPSTWPGDDNLWNVCTAIALAEGYNLGPGTAPYDLNNPGDLGPGDEHGEKTAGAAQPHGGSLIIVFAVAEGGWRALRMCSVDWIRTGLRRILDESLSTIRS